MHRALVQTFLTRSALTSDELKPLLAGLLTADNPFRPHLEGDITQPDITSFMQLANARLHPFDYEIRAMRDQITKIPVYALVNTTSDGMTQLATNFNADEIGYIKRLLDAMFETHNTRSREILAVLNVDAIRLARVPRRQSEGHSFSNGHIEEEDEEEEEAEMNGAETNGVDADGEPRVHSLRVADAERVLDQLLDQKFFLRSSAGYWSLAPRAILELRSYLKEMYNEPPEDEDDDPEGVIRVRDCLGCREIVTVGLRCSNRDCGVRFHDWCASQYLRAQRGEASRRCPKCKTAWEGNYYVGERAVGGRRRDGLENGMENGTMNGFVESEEAEEGDEGEEEEE